MTGKEIYKDMTRFWGKLFGINFALGVTTGITMEFQFGTNWAYYSHYVGEIRIPWLGGLIVTRSLDKPIKGIKQLVAESEVRIEKGMRAFGLLQKLRAGDTSPALLQEFNSLKQHLGYGLLLKRYTPKVTDATPEQIHRAALDTIPNVGVMFWSFRIMVGLGFYMLALIAVSFYYCAKREFDRKRWLLKLIVFSMPAPWIAAELGWIVAEFGRQPWTIGEVLPTLLSTSTLSVWDVIGSMAVIVVLYTGFMIAAAYLMVKFVRLGPSSLHTGRYFFEQRKAA
jgi:cytochrome d ubiquinol oxidase subunit I